MGADSNTLTKKDSVSKTQTRCRICGNGELKTYLDLGELPLANNLFDTADESINGTRYPLKVQLCDNCGLSQLSEVIDPRILFSDYAYRSSMSKTYVNHCRKMAKDFKEKYSLIVGSGADFVVDIAGNDGSLLEQFKEEIPGLRVLNIDPAGNLCKISRERGIPAHTEFFSINTALSILISYGKAQVITATNVFAHVANVRDFILSAKIILAHNGVLALEFPYVVPFIEGLEYGTVYHEHLSYIAINPLKKLCDETGLKIIDVSNQNIHCGTVRVIIAHDYSHREVEPSVSEFIENEIAKGYDKFEKYNYWSAAVNHSVTDIEEQVKKLVANGNKIAAFGASAKGNTLLNLCDFTTKEISYIVDDTPEKQNKFSPGTGIPIFSIHELINHPPDYLVVLAWNFQKEIIERCKNAGYTNRFIIPIPNFRVI